jgi:hypothetical protein
MDFEIVWIEQNFGAEWTRELWEMEARDWAMSTGQMSIHSV